MEQEGVMSDELSERAERIIRCHACDYLLEDTNYCKLWHKYGFGRSHFCSYGSPRASS